MTYKREDYKFAANNERLAFPELYIWGKDGELFECVDSPIHGFIGTRLKVKTSIGNGTILVKPEATNSDASNLITPYGALTAGVFRRLEKVNQFTEIALSIAVRKIIEGEPVFIKRTSFSEYETVNSAYTNLDEFGICDFDDLNHVSFFIKK